MKYSILLMLALFVLNPNAKAQGFKFIDTVQLIPENPGVDDTVKVRVQVTVNKGAWRINDSYSLSGDTIKITGCYFATPADILTTFEDTYTVGKLPLKQYYLSYSFFISYSASSCDPATTRTYFDSFQVGFTGIVTPKRLENSISLYPNPTYSGQTLSLNFIKPEILEVSLHDLSGRHISTVHRGVVGAGQWQKTLLLEDLLSGCYLLRINTGTESQTLKVVKY